MKDIEYAKELMAQVVQSRIKTSDRKDAHWF